MLDGDKRLGSYFYQFFRRPEPVIHFRQGRCIGRWRVRTMKGRIWLTMCLFALSLTASAQTLEFNSAYAHVSGNGGLDGFNLGTAWWPSHRLSIAFDYDSGWESGHVGVFDLTQAGTIVSKNHLQNFLVGPRIYFGTLRTKHKYLARFLPFAEGQFGASHLHSSLEEPTQN